MKKQIISVCIVFLIGTAMIMAAGAKAGLLIAASVLQLGCILYCAAMGIRSEKNDDI